MQVGFSQHALGRIKERSINAEDVMTALFEPDKYSATYGGRIQVEKKIGSRNLKVIYIEEKDTMIVITAYYTRL